MSDWQWALVPFLALAIAVPAAAAYEHRERLAERERQARALLARTMTNADWSRLALMMDEAMQQMHLSLLGFSRTFAQAGTEMDRFARALKAGKAPAPRRHRHIPWPRGGKRI